MRIVVLVYLILRHPIRSCEKVNKRCRVCKAERVCDVPDRTYLHRVTSVSANRIHPAMIAKLTVFMVLAGY